jgi:cytochrome c oxidase subunit 2
MMRRYCAGALFALAMFSVGGSAYAQQPRPWEIGMQPAGGPIKAEIISLHSLLLAICWIIMILVGALLAIVILRFRADKHPTPSQTSHNTILEVAWTAIPVLILVVIAIPSFRLLYYQDRTRDADLTVKVLAHQWYWEYTYPDQNNLNFTSYMVPDDQLKPGQLRLLDVDNQLVLPVGKNVRILTTSADVIHSFFIPSLGVQRYAIPGHTIETWLRIDKPGVFYGECNQICGENHSRMPIAVKGVTDEEFQAWLLDAKKAFSQAVPVSPSLVSPSAEPLKLASVKE